jgi:hypothetical protein
MHRRLTEVSKWEAMMTACGSSGTVTLRGDFMMGTCTPPPSPHYGDNALDAGEKSKEAPEKKGKH